MYEKRPTFNGGLEPVNVNVQTLSSRLQSSLVRLFKDELSGLVVDVDSRPTLEAHSVWRLNVPPRSPKLYAAISNLCAETNAFYREFIELGTMEPREFTVSIWCLSNSESPIKGSFD